MRLIFLLFSLVFALSSCLEENPNLRNEVDSGWVFHLQIPNDSIPVRLLITDSSVSFVNSSELIAAKNFYKKEDSLFIETQLHRTEFKAKYLNDSTISGVWYNYDRGDYSIPFVGYKSFVKQDWSDVQYEKYQVRFSPDTEDNYPAIGLLNLSESHTSGTFITETGDYRFLEGGRVGDKISLSCFDGSHLFLFRAQIKNDSLINGVFYSGNHWKEPWWGIKANDVFLNHPDSITYFKQNEQNTLNFSVLNSNGDSVHFSKNNGFSNKVTIVQVFGTWCPNCMDESVFYAELDEKYSDQGLVILPVAFERGEDFNNQVAAIQAFNDHLNISSETFIGGTASKKQASEVFSMVNEISSFPTSFFIGKDGVVRKIHTGFYGPGTGSYYERYKRETEVFVMNLLSE